MRRGLKRIIAEVSGMGCSVRLVRCHCDSRTKGNNLVYLVNCNPKSIISYRSLIFPIRLKPEEWESGDRLWLLDVVAPNRQAATAVLANFRQVAKGGNVALHPVVSAVVDPEVLAKLVVKGEG